MNYNKILIGARLTRDPDTRYTPKGTAVCDLSLAMNRVYTSAGGERKEETTFVDATAWEKRAELIQKHFHRGDPIFLEGRLTMDEWTDKEGQKRTKLKVIIENFQFVEPKKGGQYD